MSERIIKLEVENVKRIKSLAIKPPAHAVTVCGKNGQGKSSTLDSIAWALGGKPDCDKPVREGEKKMSIVCELDSIVVKRTQTAAGTTSLTVTNKDGHKLGSPQKVLDELTGTLTFDPLEFSRMKPAIQAETLRQLAGLDFTELDKMKAAAYEFRTDVGRDCKALKGSLDLMETHPDVPEDEISIIELSDKLSVLQHRESIHGQNLNALEMWRSRADEKHREIARLKDEAEAFEVEVKKSTRLVDGYKPQNTEELSEQLSNAEETNAKVRDNKLEAKTRKEFRAIEKKYRDLTNEIETYDETKRELIESAEFPVKGLKLTENGVTFNDIPFDQLSASEQLRVSVNTGIAMNPKLKVLLVKDGCLLDSDSLEELRAIATEKDCQVWIERLEGDADCTVVISDGEVAK